MERFPSQQSLLPTQPTGEMASRIDLFDWSVTPLGSRNRWPQSLKTLVETILLQSIPAVILWGPDLTQIYNDAYAVFAGAKHPAALGMATYASWPEVAHFTRPLYDRVLAGESVSLQDQLFNLARADEVEETFITVFYSPVKNDQGMIVGLLAILTETTGQVRAERERVAVEAEQARLNERLSLALSAADLGTWDWDPITDQITLSPRAAAMYGVESDRVVTRSWMRGLLHADHRDLAAKAAQQAVQDRVEYNQEYIVEREDGQQSWVNARGRGRFDPEGKLIRMLGVVQDITERKISERERERLVSKLEAETARLSAAFMQSPAFMCVLHGPTHIFEYVNERYYWMVGDREIIGKPIAEALPEVVAQGYVKLLDQVYLTGKQFVGKDMPVSIIRTPGGVPDQRIIEFVYQPIQDANGTTIGVFVHGIDSTDAKRAHQEREQLLEAERSARADSERANRIKDEFLATLSHELRTPLNAIVGWARVLRRKPPTPEDLTTGLETIERNARAQAQIIEDLLDMSRIVSGKVRLDIQEVDLVSVVNTGTETLRHAAEGKEIRLVTILDPSAGPVTGDPNRLQQVVWNLVSNAVKFTPKGGRVQVVLARVDSHVELSVIDTGVGIKPEFQAQVFDRFRQADSSITRTHGGLGLGLAIVKQLVELHGGTVRVSSLGEGQGTTFTVSLPLKIVRIETPPQDMSLHSVIDPIPELDLDAGATLKGVRILVVDDEPDARNLVKRILDECGAIVATVGSAAEAVERIRNEPFGMLVSDIGMPGEDGYSLIRRVRSIAAHGNATIPALALTAYARSEDRVRAIRAGFNMHVVKPIDPAELVTMVASLVGTRQGSSG